MIEGYKHINAFLNQKQSDNLFTLFEVALEHVASQDVTDNKLLPEEIDELKEIFIRQTAQGRFDSATSTCPRNERGFTN